MPSYIQKGPKLSLPANKTMQTNVAFGLGNGSDVDFTVTPPTGFSYVYVNTIYRTDWQGTVTLSASPRTNLSQYSEDMSHVTVNSGTITKTASTLTDASSTVVSLCSTSNNTIPNDNSTYTASFFVGKASGITAYTLRFFGTDTVDSNSIVMDNLNGYVSPSGAGYITESMLVEDFGVLGWRVSLIGSDNKSNIFNTLRIYPAWGSSYTLPYPASDVTAVTGVSITKLQIEKTPAQNVLVNCEGDSITANVQAPPWPQYLGLVLGTSLLNTAAGSSTTTQMRSRFDTYKGNNGTHFAIMGGVNDIAGDVAISTIKENLSYMWSTARANGMLVIVMTISPWGGSSAWTASRQAVTEELNAWIRDQASSNGYILVDAYNLLNNPSNLGYMLPGYVKADNIHPNASGQQILASDLLSRLNLPKPYTSYIGPTTTAPVTVTDYTVSGLTYTMAETPLTGAILSYTGYSYTSAYATFDVPSCGSISIAPSGLTSGKLQITASVDGTNFNPAVILPIDEATGVLAASSDLPNGFYTLNVKPFKSVRFTQTDVTDTVTISTALGR